MTDDLPIRERFCPRDGFDLAQGQECPPGVAFTCPICLDLLVSRGLPWCERIPLNTLSPDMRKRHEAQVRNIQAQKRKYLAGVH